MPQMFPLAWLYLMLLFTLTLMMINSFNYFFFNYKFMNLSENLFKNLNKNNLKWKW